MQQDEKEKDPPEPSEGNQTNKKSQSLSHHTQTLTNSTLFLPKPLQPIITNLVTTIQNPNPLLPSLQASQLIQSLSDTIKKATQPQINSFTLDTGFNANLYPVFGIIAWKNQQLGYHAIDWRVCSFVESGGVRCVPVVQCNLQDAKNMASFKSQLQNVHGLVIPEFTQQNSTGFLEKLFDLIAKHEKNLFVYCLGSSSNFLLSKNYESTFKTTKPKSGLIEGRLIHVLQSNLLSDMNIVLKLKTLSQQVSYPIKCLPKIDLSQLNKVQQLSVQCYIITSQKGSQILPWLLKQRPCLNITIYHSFIEMYDQTCTKGIQYFNKGMINLVNVTKEKFLNVKNPTKYVAHYPLEFKDSPQKAHYKIVSNPQTK